MTSQPDPARGRFGGLVSVATAAVTGTTGHPVRVEVHAALGLPGFDVVGAPSHSVRETRDRVRAAIISSGLAWPNTRITLTITPPRGPDPPPVDPTRLLPADRSSSRWALQRHSCATVIRNWR